MTQPTIVSKNGRSFPAYAVALQAIIINENEEILLLNSLRRNQGWQIVSGGLDADETILDGTLREVGEEVGKDARVRPLGLVHTHSFHYDTNVRFMVGTYYLFAFEDGTITPGDDMVGSEVRWWTIPELETEKPILHPSTHLWMLKRAVALYRLWKDEGERQLQPNLEI